MFIDSTMNIQDLRSSGARCFRAMIRTALRFAPLERGGVFWSRAFYKHWVPTGRGKRLENLDKKQEVRPLYYRRTTRNRPHDHETLGKLSTSS